MLHNNNKIQFLLIQCKIKCISLDELRCVERMMTLCAFSLCLHIFFSSKFLQKPLIFAATDVSTQSLKSVDTFNGIRNVMPHLSLHSVQWTRSVSALQFFFLLKSFWRFCVVGVLGSKVIHKHSNFTPKIRSQSEWEKWGANLRSTHTQKSWVQWHPV